MAGSGPVPVGVGGWSAATAAVESASGESVVTTVEAGESTEVFRVLLIDNRPERRELMRHLVAATGLADADVAEAATAPEATALLERGDRDVAVVEIQLPVALGLETIAAVRSHSPGLKIVVCSFHRDEATKAQAVAQGADAYLDKPVSSLSLQNVFRRFTLESPAQRPGR
jgi:CheY-like chemotaxis protein